MNARSVCDIAVLLLSVTAGYAAPYWVTWEDGWPEEQGWTRIHSNPPAERWLEDGKLFIDSRADWGIGDGSRMDFSGIGAPGPGETFIMRWRLKVDYCSTFIGDSGVYVISDDQHEVAFLISEERIYSAYESNKWATFQAGVFHDYELRSTDMRDYQLLIDGQLALSGTFFEGLFSRCVEWGDLATNRSLAEWDWVRFGVVPEPATWAAALFVMAFAHRRRAPAVMSAIAGASRPARQGRSSCPVPRCPCSSATSLGTWSLVRPFGPLVSCP